jgi:hypothetical protein
VAPYQSLDRLMSFLCQLYLRMRGEAPKPHAAQRWCLMWYACLPQRRHGMCTAWW